MFILCVYLFGEWGVGRRCRGGANNGKYSCDQFLRQGRRRGVASSGGGIKELREHEFNAVTVVVVGGRLLNINRSINFTCGA